MSNIDITRMSSKGQVVIPQDLRKGINEGDKLFVIRNKDQIILKKASNLDEALKEDLEFARRTEKAYKSIEKGRYISIDSENIFEEMSKW